MSEKKNCKQCESKSTGKVILPMVIFGFYILGAAIYGTYIIIQDIIRIFK